MTSSADELKASALFNQDLRKFYYNAYDLWDPDTYVFTVTDLTHIFVGLLNLPLHEQSNKAACLHLRALLGNDIHLIPLHPSPVCNFYAFTHTTSHSTCLVTQVVAAAAVAATT